MSNSLKCVAHENLVKFNLVFLVVNHIDQVYKININSVTEFLNLIQLNRGKLECFDNLNTFDLY